LFGLVETLCNGILACPSIKTGGAMKKMSVTEIRALEIIFIYIGRQRKALIHHMKNHKYITTNKPKLKLYLLNAASTFGFMRITQISLYISEWFISRLNVSKERKRAVRV